VHSDESRNLFLAEYGGEFISKLFMIVKNVLETSVDCFSKSLELAVIFLHNLSLSNGGAIAILKSGLANTFNDVLSHHSENENLVVAIAQTLNTLYHPEKCERLAYLGYRTAANLVETLCRIPPTAATIQLITQIKIVFPGI
jgi:hypothetical protein